MNEIVLERLKSYQRDSIEGEKQALREIIQEIALLGLWRGKFFEHAAFYGGTALRILYGLDRYSEDLDFTLLGVRKGFSLGTYGTAIKEELRAYGFEVELQLKPQISTIDSAFIKANTLHHLIKVASKHRAQKGEILNIKLEIDTDPALGFTTEAKQLFWPLLYSVTSCDLPSLFAGKIHAILCRERVKNIKGRDWYDFLWYISRRTGFNGQYLQSKLQQSGVWPSNAVLTLEDSKNFLHEKIEALDIEAAKRDIVRFIEDTQRLDAWTKPAFHAAVDQLKLGS